MSKNLNFNEADYSDNFDVDSEIEKEELEKDKVKNLNVEKKKEESSESSKESIEESDVEQMSTEKDTYNGSISSSESVTSSESEVTNEEFRDLKNLENKNYLTKQCMLGENKNNNDNENKNAWHANELSDKTLTENKLALKVINKKFENKSNQNKSLKKPLKEVCTNSCLLVDKKECQTNLKKSEQCNAKILSKNLLEENHAKIKKPLNLNWESCNKSVEIEKEKEINESYSSEMMTEVSTGETHKFKSMKNFIWNSYTPYKELDHFKDIGNSIQTSRNQNLSRTYFYPELNVYTDFTEEDCRRGRKMLQRITENKNFVKPPKWFIKLPEKIIFNFIKIYNLLEGPKTSSTKNRVFSILESCDLGIRKDHLDDLVSILKVKHDFSNIDFDELVFSLASLDLIRKLLVCGNNVKNENEGMTNTQNVLFTIATVFTVASSCAGLENPVAGVPECVFSLFKNQMISHVSAKKQAYNSMVSRFRHVKNFKNSPYFKPILPLAKMINTQAGGNTEMKGRKKPSVKLNPILQHMKTKDSMDFKVDRKILQEIMSIYTKNGALISSLPDVHRVPMVRELLAQISIFEPLSASVKKKDYLRQSLVDYEFETLKEMETKNRSHMEEFQDSSVSENWNMMNLCQFCKAQRLTGYKYCDQTKRRNERN